MKSVFTFLALVFTISINAQVTWNFGTVSPGDANPTSGVLANSTVSAVTRVNGSANGFLETTSPSNNGGASGSYNAAAVATAGAFNISTSTYFEFTITPSSGFRVSIAGASMNSRSTGTGPTQFSLRTSFDNFATDVATATAAQNSAWSAKSFSPFTTATGAIDMPVTVRIYGFSSAASGANNWRIDDLSFTYAIGVLSVNLKSFSAILYNNNVNLKWLTSNESNTKNYTIEKSINGISFNSIGNVNAKNGIENTYQFTENNVTNAVVYYRLRIQTLDDKITYSNILKVDNFNTKSTMQLYPTIATTNLTMKLKAEKNQMISVNVIDITGKILSQNNYNVNNGVNTISVNTTHLNAGVYFLKVIGENINETSKFIKN